MFTRRPCAARLRAAAPLALVLSLAVAASQSAVHGQSPATRLTTVLADLTRVVPQETTTSQAVAAQATVPMAFDAMPKSLQDAVRSRRLRINAQNQVQVYVLLTAVSTDVVSQLQAMGAVVEYTDAARSRVQALVPATRLQAVAALPFVTAVRLPTYARRQVGAATSEGDAIIASDITRQQFSIDGTGVKVGVISDGLKGVFASGCTTCGGVSGGPMATGDLPASVGTRTGTGVLTSSTGGITGQSFASNRDLEGKPPASPPCAFAGAGAEGTALLEVVHDIAPGAQLSFANADTDVAFSAAVNSLAASNDVVVDDLGFYGEANDGTSGVSSNTAAALNNPSNRIRTYVTAVGNGADEHYIGNYVDSGIDGTTIPGITNHGHLHLFQRSGTTTDVLNLGDQPYNVIALPTNGEVVVFLTWNEPFGRAASNYDLFLVQQSTKTVVARSVDLQNGSQDPVEAIDFTNTGASDLFRIVIQNVQDQAPPRQLDLFSFQPECAHDGPRLLAPGHHERHNFNTASQSVAAQGDAGGSPVSVISVGAICSGSPAAVGVFVGSTPDESCADRLHTTLEFFSSQGPTIDGRTKPDIASIDGVSITGAGSFENPFFGTSAAAPHVAGTAALLLQAVPCLVSGASGALDPVAARTALRGFILAGAQPLSGSPPDNAFGAGLENAFRSVRSSQPSFSGPAAVVVPGNTPAGASLTASQIGFSGAGQCGTSMKWSGGCGTSPGASLSCPFGATALAVSASNGGITFTDPVNLQIVVTSFGVAAAPGAATIPAGQTATYHVTVAAQGGAFQNSVTLSCANVPAGSSCAFTPAIVTPGSGSAGSTLVVTTTARASAPAGWWLRGRGPTGGVRLALVLAALGLLLGGVVRALSSWPIRVPDGLVGRVPGAIAVALAVGAAALTLACGGSSPPPGAGSPLAVSPSALQFPSETVLSTSAPQTITVSNTTASAVAISGVTAAGDFAQTNTCSGPLIAGASCLVGVTFTPVTAGSRSGSLTIATTGSTTPQQVALMGAGVNATGGTPAGTYQLAVAGSAGTLVEATTVSLTVQ